MTDKLEHLKQIREWAMAARATAIKQRGKGDVIGAELANMRVTVYNQCADLVEVYEDLHEAAQQMMSVARTNHVGQFLSISECDETCMRYTRARAFQFVALSIDSTLPEVQPKWKE